VMECINNRMSKAELKKFPTLDTTIAIERKIKKKNVKIPKDLIR
jgi:phosphoribosylpyrophosphate synthetase